MVQVKKCQSKKHQFGGCGNPRCPEGLSIQVALKKAVASQDFNDFLEAKQLEGKNIQAGHLFSPDYKGYSDITLDVDGETFQGRVPVEAEGVYDQLAAIDKTVIPSFATSPEMSDYVKDLYGPHVMFHFNTHHDRGETRYPSASVGELHVHAAYRGLGVGSHILNIAKKFADDHNMILGITPTNVGDGSIRESDENDEARKVANLKHRDRLVAFYGRHGFIMNKAFYYHGEKDYLTGEKYQYDYEVIDAYPPAERNQLADVGMMVRLPQEQNVSVLTKKVRKKRIPNHDL